jgi:uncharacterized membrane protein HdeD (DUF308 family)
MRDRSSFDWLELIEGILLIALGVLTFMRPDGAITGIVVVYGVMAVIMGIADILLYVRLERYTGFGPVVSLISGILSVMTGLMLLIYPTAGKIILTVLFPIWFIAHCISRLSSLNRIRFFAGDFAYCFTLVLNVIGLVLGVMMLIDPWLSLMSIRCIISFYLVLLGIDCVMLAVCRR